MALIKCKECGAGVSNWAKACPKCGAPVPKGKEIAIGLGLCLLIGFGISMCTSSNNKKQSSIEATGDAIAQKTIDTRKNYGYYEISKFAINDVQKTFDTDPTFTDFGLKILNTQLEKIETYDSGDSYVLNANVSFNGQTYNVPIGASGSSENKKIAWDIDVNPKSCQNPPCGLGFLVAYQRKQVVDFLRNNKQPADTPVETVSVEKVFDEYRETIVNGEDGKAYLQKYNHNNINFVGTVLRINEVDLPQLIMSNYLLSPPWMKTWNQMIALKNSIGAVGMFIYIYGNHPFLSRQMEGQSVSVSCKQTKIDDNQGVPAIYCPTTEVSIIPTNFDQMDSQRTNPLPQTAEPAYQTSFDCTKAKSVPENLICHDPELAEQDRDLAALHQQAKDAATDKEAFTELVRKQWSYREKNCHDKECLMLWYKDEKRVLSEISGTGDVEEAAKNQ
jgi:hypothetical protein